MKRGKGIGQDRKRIGGRIIMGKRKRRGGDSTGRKKMRGRIIVEARK